jgi:peptidyl-prolyl cis-trans isomerase SurA
LPDELKEIGRTQPVGQPSPPIQVDTGIGIFMVCSRTVPPDASVPSREVINRSLFAQRLDQLSRGYLRDLRRAAVIDIRNAAL